MTCRPFFCEVLTVSSPARATKDTLPSGSNSTPQSARASASFRDSLLTVSPLAMASFTTLENLDEFVWSVRPALSASMCLASQPMHFPMTTPSFHATLETEMAFLVSQRLHVYTNVNRSESGTWTRATLLGSSSPKPLPAFSEVERVRWSGVKADCGRERYERARSMVRPARSRRWRTRGAVLEQDSGTAPRSIYSLLSVLPTRVRSSQSYHKNLA